MPLNFNKDIFATESVDQELRAIGRVLRSARAFACSVRRPAERNGSRRRISGEGAGNRSAAATAPQKRDQAFGECRKLVPLHSAFPFFAAQMRLCKQLT